MDAGRTTDGQDDRNEQEGEEPFADLKRIDVRVQRIVDHGKAIRLRDRLIQEAAKTVAFVAVALGALLFAAFAYFASDTRMTSLQAGTMQGALMVAIICGFIGALCCGKTSRIWRDYRGAKSGTR
jgi:hypothetical protein